MSDSNKLNEQFQEFIAAQQTLLFATATPDGLPELSVAPFVCDDNGSFFITVSELAGHTANLINNPFTSVMLIRSEAESSNLFARERVIYSCTVTEVPAHAACHKLQIQALIEKFGEIAKLISSLGDFHLFEFIPQRGKYILGFGQAYQINLEDQSLRHISRSIP